jgi:tetratricopeptide (TPR) repeat protein
MVSSFITNCGRLYNQAIHFKSDFYPAWYNRGVRLNDLGHYEEAVANYNEVLRLTQYQFWQACVNRGQTILFLQDYKAALANWDQGISALLPTTPNYQYACGELQHRKGRTQYQAGKNQLNPFPEWFAARDTAVRNWL